MNHSGELAFQPLNLIYIINLIAHIYMSAVAGQTAGPNWLNFFEDTHEYWLPWG